MDSDLPPDKVKWIDINRERCMVLPEVSRPCELSPTATAKRAATCSLSQLGRNQTGLSSRNMVTGAEAAMDQMLTERYRDRLVSVLSCYDRIVITGTLTAGGMLRGRDDALSLLSARGCLTYLLSHHLALSTERVTSHREL